jgi:tetratricopeptide (TPR) repeat protein
MKIRILPPLAVLLLGVALGSAQSAPAAASDSTAEPSRKAKTGSGQPDKAAAYYHYALGHVYEEMAGMYGRSDYANRAIQEYRLAMENDPASGYLDAALAELYAKTGRIRDAVTEAQEILKRDPNNIEARKLLGRIYLRSLGDMQSGTQSTEVLKRAIEQYEALVKLQPSSVEDHLLLGRLYRLNNEIDKAENEFTTAIKIQPYSEEAITTLAYLYNEKGNPARAAEVLNSIPDANRSGRLYSALGYTYEQQKDYKKAVSAYRKAVELDHDNLDAMRGLAQNLANDGQADAALEQYKIIVEADPQDPQSYMRMAEIYRRDGKFDQALDALKQAQKYVQDSLEVPYHMAIVYQALGRTEEAITTLQDLVKKTEKPQGNYTSGERNNLAVFLERLGSVYRENGKTQLAVETFRRMLSLGDENMSRGYQEIVDTYREAKNWAQAMAVAKEGVSKLPKDRNLKLTLAAQLADSGQGEQALAQAKSLLKGAPEDREVYLSLAQMSSRLKRYKEAEEFMNQAAGLSNSPEEKSYLYFVWGAILERQKRYDEAEQMFRKVLDNDQRNAMALNYLGYMLADRGVRLEEALGYLKKAVALEPQNGAYLDSIGWAYFKLGDYDRAEDNLRRASERIGNDPTVQDHLGELYAKTGRLKLATVHWERAIAEWNRSVPAEIDNNDIQRVTKKLESAKVKLARQQGANKAEAAKP